MASRFWRLAAQYFAGGVGLVLVTFVCVRFGQDIHVAASGYLILIVLLALKSEFIGSLVLSVAAAGCLTYFFAPSLLSFRIDDLEAPTTIAAFLTISFFVTGLIIQRKRAEDETRASEARFRTFVDHATDAFFLLDDNWTILDVNRQACHVLGYSREELIGKHKSDFDIGLDGTSIQRLKQRTVAGEAISFETRHRRKDGTSFPVEVRLNQFEEGGRRYLCLVRDISERKRAEEDHERLRQLEADLAHVNRISIMGELASSLAHEILQPIATARNNARTGMRFLELNPPNLGEVKEAFACIVRDADRANDIVGRMRDHIKKAPPRREPFDLNEVIHEVIAIAGSTIDKNRVSVHTRLMVGLTPVRGDRVQLQQVVLNLILNSAEALSSVDEGDRELSISTAQSQTSDILVKVQDSGPGIDPEHLERVFAAFYTTKTSGIGMGLSICRSIIAAHGGRLWAEANRPQGAIFQFTLPAGLEDS